MSVRHSSYSLRPSSASASVAVPAQSVSRPMRERVIARSSRISASSSTTSTCALFMSGPAHNGEACALRRVHEVELGIIRFAHFARDVESQARAARRGREEWLEQLSAERGRDARTIVHHVQFYIGTLLDLVDRDPNAAFLPPAMPQGVSTQIPHHLIQVTAVEDDSRLRMQLEAENLGTDSLDLAELLHEKPEVIDDF